MDPDATHLDGNVAGGALGALFPFEMTMALLRCAHCGSAEPVGAQLAYMSEMGTVVRCVHCSAALLSIVRGRDRIWLGMHGSTWISIDAPAADA